MTPCFFCTFAYRYLYKLWIAITDDWYVKLKQNVVLCCNCLQHCGCLFYLIYLLSLLLLIVVLCFHVEVNRAVFRIYCVIILVKNKIFVLDFIVQWRRGWGKAIDPIKFWAFRKFLVQKLSSKNAIFGASRCLFLGNLRAELKFWHLWSPMFEICSCLLEFCWKFATSVGKFVELPVSPAFIPTTPLLKCTEYHYLRQGGYVFAGVCLSVC